jgi:hypothetical protein
VCQSSAADLRDRGVDVQSLQLVAAGGERLENASAVESLRQLAPAILLGERGEVVQHFVHAAVLALENPLQQRVVERSNP